MSGGEACYWQTSNSTIIDNFDDLLEMEGSFIEFKPTLLLVATWKDAIISFKSLQVCEFIVTFKLKLSKVYWIVSMFFRGGGGGGVEYGRRYRRLNY